MASLEFRIAELERRMANMMMVGTIDQLDEAKALVKVKCGDLVTGWIPWFTRRAGPDRDWCPPEPVEQVMVFSPNGDPAQGVAMPSIYQTAHPAPGNKKTVRRIEFADGGFIEYDRATGKLTGSFEALARLIGKGTIELVGADGAAVKGIVQGDCLCALTGKPHPMISATVKGSL